MLGKPMQLGTASLPDEELKKDKKNCRKFGPCGVGEKALYLNSFYIERQYYIPLCAVKRAFKRIAMSKGGFTGKGMFATIPYLVVEYEDGKQKQCNFKVEEDVDRLQAYLKKTHPEICLYSADAEQRLLEKEKELQKKKEKVQMVTPRAAENIRVLEKCAAYLEKQPELSADLSTSAKQKRTYDRSNPAYRWVAFFIVLMGMVSLLYGVYSLIHHEGMAMYFLLFGLAAIFLFSGANVLPTQKNQRRYREKQLKNAVDALDAYIRKYPEFPLPAHYAHPLVLKRMEEILADNRADTIPQALEVLKEDLKALNSSVAVEQEEYDEIMTIKPMFLVMDYQN
jgi:hypothetical protein